MTGVGLISDTHGYLDPKVFEHFAGCDQIWHAGDFGPTVAEQLAKFKPLKAVYGNVDDADVKDRFPVDLRFTCEHVDVWMTHIGGYPGKYDPRIAKQIKANPPDLFISGHSHILKVMRDLRLNNLLHINPGAAGVYGFHRVRTIIRFKIDGRRITGVEVIELGHKKMV